MYRQRSEESFTAESAREPAKLQKAQSLSQLHVISTKKAKPTRSKHLRNKSRHPRRSLSQRHLSSKPSTAEVASAHVLRTDRRPASRYRRRRERLISDVYSPERDIEVLINAFVWCLLLIFLFTPVSLLAAMFIYPISFAAEAITASSCIRQLNNWIVTHLLCLPRFISLAVLNGWYMVTVCHIEYYETGYVDAGNQEEVIE